MKRIVALLALTLVAACGGDVPRTLPTRTPSPTPSDTAAPSPSPTGTLETTEVTIYYLASGPGEVFLVPERHRVARTEAIARAALEELVHGTAQDPDHSTPFPPAARIEGVAIRDGVATVDWSAEVLAANAGAEVESRGIQSIVYTLTEFASVRKVRFTVEGAERGTASNGRTIEDWWGHVGLADQPWARRDAIEVLAPVMLWTPLDGARSSGAIGLTGEASTFEANVGIILRDARGKVVVQTNATATEGAPGRGTFTRTITFTPPATPETWTVEASDASEKDGSLIYAETRRIRVG